MTSYRLAWLTLIAQRDNLYLQLAAAVLVGGALYFTYQKLWPTMALKLAVIMYMLGFTGAIIVGFFLWV